MKLLLLLLSLNIFAQAEMKEMRSFKKEMAELKQSYSGIDAVIDSLSLPVGLTTELKDDAKQKLKDEMKQRINHVIQARIALGKKKHEAEIAEEKCMDSIDGEPFHAEALIALPSGTCSELMAKMQELSEV